MIETMKILEEGVSHLLWPCFISLEGAQVSQSSEDKDEHDGDLLREFHVQAPDVGKRHSQQHEICHDIRYGDANKELGNINAGPTFDRRIPSLSNGGACKDRGGFLQRVSARDNLLVFAPRNARNQFTT